MLVTNLSAPLMLAAISTWLDFLVRVQRGVFSLSVLHMKVVQGLDDSKGANPEDPQDDEDEGVEVILLVNDGRDNEQ